MAREHQHIAPGSQSFSLYSGLAMARGQGSTLVDEDGNEYIDFIAGIGVGSVGHGHPHYVEALQRQAERLTFGSFTTENRARFLQLLARSRPGAHPDPALLGRRRGGGGALRLARAATGKNEIIGFWGGFHGKTGGVLRPARQQFKHPLGPLMPGQHSTPVCRLLPLPAAASSIPSAGSPAPSTCAT